MFITSLVFCWLTVCLMLAYKAEEQTTTLVWVCAFLGSLAFTWTYVAEYFIKLAFLLNSF